MAIGIKLFKQINSFGDNTAIRLSDQKLSYRDLNKGALLISSLIEEMKIKSEVVGIIGQRNFSAYLGMLGSVYAGRTYVPINAKYTLSTIIKIIKDSRMELLICDLKSLERIKDVISTNEIKFIVVPTEAVLDKGLFGSKVTIYDKNDLNYSLSGTPVAVAKTNILYILYTSGTTGNPKGVMVTNDNVDVFLRNTKSFYDLEMGFRASQTFDLSFDASVVDIYFTFMNGGQLCVLNESELLMPYDYIQREKLNVWYSVPTLADLMFKMGYLVPNSFPLLKYSFFGGEALPQKLADAWRLAAPNSTIENVYGPTEATVNISRFNYLEKYTERKFKNDILSIGTTFEEHSFAILKDDLSKVKNGKVGELAFKGPQIAKGYLNDPKKTNKVFRSLPWDKTNRKWYLTGDLAFVNQFNEIECLGRKDDQIKLAGRRIELGEIENALLKSSHLKDVVVVPKKDENGKVITLVAFTTTNLNTEEKNKVLKHSLNFIEKLFLPKKIVRIESFPIMSSGKTDRKKLAVLA